MTEPAPEWPKCAFHGVEGHMIGSPTCQRDGGPAYIAPNPTPAQKAKTSPPRAETIDPDEDYYSNFVDGRGY